MVLEERGIADPEISLLRDFMSCPARPLSTIILGWWCTSDGNSKGWSTRGIL